MSYGSMAEEYWRCDFPGCIKHFDQSGGRVAIVKDGQNLAFCKEHSIRLVRAGVALRVLAEIHAQQKETEEAPRRKRWEEEQRNREEIFIQSLKSVG